MQSNWMNTTSYSANHTLLRPLRKVIQLWPYWCLISHWLIASKREWCFWMRWFYSFWLTSCERLPVVIKSYSSCSIYPSDNYRNANHFIVALSWNFCAFSRIRCDGQLTSGNRLLAFAGYRLANPNERSDGSFGCSWRIVSIVLTPSTWQCLLWSLQIVIKS